MADIPTLSELQSQIETDLRTILGITKIWIGKVFLRVLATVQAAKLKLFYLFVVQLRRNIWVDTCEQEELYRFGLVKLNRLPTPAVAGVYTADITGATGGEVLKGTIYKNLAKDKLYEVVTTVVLSGSTGQIQVRSLEGGTASALVITDTITSTIPLINVNSDAIIASVDTTPVEAETLEAYRSAIILSFQLEPQGGAATDYRIWSSDAPGVRITYPYKKSATVNTVIVYVEATVASSEVGQPAGVAHNSMLAEVLDVIELDPDTTKPINERGRRPIQVTVETASVIPVGVTITIIDLSDKSSPVISAITTGLNDYFYTIRPYIAAADGENKKDTIYQSRVIEAIANSIEESITFSNVTITIGGITYGQYTFGDIPGSYGNYPYLFSLLTP